jgi:hypothetical protein
LAYGWSQSALFLPFRRGVLVVWGVSGVVRQMTKCNNFVPGFSPPFFFFLIQKYAALLRIQEKKSATKQDLVTGGMQIQITLSWMNQD